MQTATPPANHKLVGMVVNYYSRPDFPPSVRGSTALALQRLRENRGVGTILLVDGSPVPDAAMEKMCQLLDVRYHYAGKELGFAAGFNTGWKLLDELLVGLMANDVFPPSDTVEKLTACLNHPEVGCVFPYLSECDYPAQIHHFVRRAVTCEPTGMTLNLNLFKREVLEQVGGVDESYSGSYNDLVMLMKIRKAGWRAVLVGDTRVPHLGQMTISQGTTYKRESDRVRFAEEHREYVAAHGLWQVKHWKRPLATTRIATLLWWVSQNNISTRFRNWSQKLVMKREPELTRFPAIFGKSDG